ncbi:MAG TPA: hypothetical protein VFK57_07865 [Vicinamibacterales bacterium]|nr:hypothetical protein [Vicinamibacterales bacterium]
MARLSIRHYGVHETTNGSRAATKLTKATRITKKTDLVFFVALVIFVAFVPERPPWRV